MKPQILRDLRFLFSLVVACGPTGVSGAAWGRAAPWAAARPSDGVACGAAGVPGAGGPGRCVCRWAAARPRAVRAASLRLGASSRSPARPRHRPPAPRQVPPAPTTPVGPGVLTCGWVRRLEARPGPAATHGHRSQARRFLWASWGSRVLSFWGALVRVVTNVVNWRCFSCGFLPRCYERCQSEGFFAENRGFWA